MPSDARQGKRNWKLLLVNVGKNSVEKKGCTQPKLTSDTEYKPSGDQ